MLLLALRFLMGAAQAPLFPVIGGRATCNWFPVSGWALPNSLQNAGLTFGSAATGVVIAWLAERFGWRQSFVLTARAECSPSGWTRVTAQPDTTSMRSASVPTAVRSGH